MDTKRRRERNGVGKDSGDTSIWFLYHEARDLIFVLFRKGAPVPGSRKSAPVPGSRKSHGSMYNFGSCMKSWLELTTFCMYSKSPPNHTLQFSRSEFFFSRALQPFGYSNTASCRDESA